MKRSAVLLFLLVLGCQRQKVVGAGCVEDKDCGDPASAYRCETQTGVCYCRTNDACPPRQYCNPAGFCQDRSGCEKNSDCLDDSLFCDTTTGSCLNKGRCSSDLQCELGNICDLSRATCVPGCHSNGDCAGSSCRCGDLPCVCTGQTPADIAKCQVGECDPNFCSDQNFCKFGEKCGVPGADAGVPVGDAGMNVSDAGVVRNSCYTDYDNDRRPYCDNCSFGGGISVCGTGANYCLIDTANPGNFYCGTDCSGGESCPRGYGCSDVIVVFQSMACTRANPSCQINNTLECTKDADCKRGGTCVIPTGLTVGHCAGKCAIDEGDNNGFCTCQVDSDCAQETCSLGECSISRKKCVDSNDCRPIRCVDYNGGGGCLIGQNCAPSNGLSCLQVK